MTASVRSRTSSRFVAIAIAAGTLGTLFLAAVPKAALAQTQEGARVLLREAAAGGFSEDLGFAAASALRRSPWEE